MPCMETWRASWSYPTTLLCAYGFLITVKPLEPFYIPYMTGPDKNFTLEQLTNVITPVSTYSYLSVLIPIFLLTDWLRYKPTVVLQCSALLTTTAMLLWLGRVTEMWAMQFFYGMSMAGEVAYFSYIYSVVELRHYRKATSYCRAAQLTGYTVGSVLGQLLVSFGLLSYYYILVFTLVLIGIAWVIAWLLPMPQRSMFFHRRGSGDKWQLANDHQTDLEVTKTVEVDEINAKNTSQIKDPKPDTRGCSSPDSSMSSVDRGGHLSGTSETRASVSCAGVMVQLWRDFLLCYATPGLLRWSLWWALATCGYNLVLNYVQMLWEHIEPSSSFAAYNGGVEAVSSLFGAATAYGIGFSKVNWHHWGELALSSFSAMGGGALYLMVFSGNIWACYCGYVLFKCLYMLLITIAINLGRGAFYLMVFSGNIWACYCGYVLFKCLYMLLITIAMFQIAADLSMERYALIFGVNTFGALVLQTIITSVAIDSRGLGLDVVTQFIIYGSYYCFIALIFFVWGVYINVQRRRHRETPEEDAVVIHQEHF